jgi:glutamate synthase domain-containing protein 3
MNTCGGSKNVIVCGSTNSVVGDVVIGSSLYERQQTMSYAVEEFIIKTKEEKFELISIIKELRERVAALESFIEEFRMSPDMPEGKQMMEEAKEHFLKASHSN